MLKKSNQKPFTFGSKFEDSFLKNQLNNPKNVIIELIANSWDAGANKVNIQWPIIEGMKLTDEKFLIIDNGSGISSEEFIHCWSEIGFDKRRNNVQEINLDNNVRRKIIGKNGKGKIGIVWIF